MRRWKLWVIIAFMYGVGWLISPLPALLGSNITLATFYGTISVSNNDTATTLVTSNITNISTSALISGGFINSDADDLAIRNTTGADVTFMPGSGTDAWMTWVASIGENTYLTYLLYTGNVTDGKIRYFPDTTGMTTTDDASMELGNRFILELAGYVSTTSGSDKDLFFKDEAFRTYISASGNITAAFFNWGNPTGNVDSGGTWSNEANAYDNNTGTLANETVPGTSWGNFLELTRASTQTHKIRYWVNRENANIANMDVDVYYSAAWQNVFQGVPSWGAWEEQDLGGTYGVTAIRFRFENVAGGAADARVMEADLGTWWDTEVTAAGQTSGEKTVKVAADGTDLKIYIDDVEQDSAALSGASVPDNGEDIIVGRNGAMPYIEYVKVWN